MKRYTYIIIGIIVAAAIAILVLFLIKNHSANPSAGSTGTTTGTLPVSGTQGTNGAGTGTGTSQITLPSSTSTADGASGQMTVQNFGVLSSDPVVDYFVDAKNNITAIQPDGEIVSISNGQSTTVNTSTISDIISASFSYDGKKIVVSYGDPTDPQGGIFTVTTNAWTSLPQGMLSPQWSPTNNYKIAYLVTTNSGKLALASIDATNLKASPSTLFTLNADDLTLQWPTQNEFILSDKPSSENAGSIWAFNSQAGTLTPLIYEIPGAEGVWSHNAAIPYGLVSFSTASSQGGTLQLEAISGTLPTQPLGFRTLPSKCVFNTEQVQATSTTATSTKTKTPATPASYLALYCGIPRPTEAFNDANLPDDYNTMALFTSDDLYKIDTATGNTQSLWSDATQNVDVSDLKFFNNALFFVNRYDHKLYGLTFTN